MTSQLRIAWKDKGRRRSVKTAGGPRRRHLQIESLEPRDLLSASPLPDWSRSLGRVLSLRGTPAADTVSVQVVEQMVVSTTPLSTARDANGVQQAAAEPSRHLIVNWNGQSHDFGLTSRWSRILFDGGRGDDSFTNATATPCRAHGGRGNDTLVGGHAADQLYGDQGNDILDGEAGHDLLFGGDGNDTLRGGDWSGIQVPESFRGEPGNDHLYGGRGNDLLIGGAGTDFLFGGDGDDRLFGDWDESLDSGQLASQVVDVLVGGNGSDDLYCDRKQDLVIANNRDRIHDEQTWVADQAADMAASLRDQRSRSNADKIALPSLLASDDTLQALRPS